jgi:hypothetical protein
LVVVVVLDDDVAVVVVAVGAVVVGVVVAGVVVVVATGVVPSTAWRSATSVAEGTLGRLLADGPNPTVINCVLRSLRSAAFVVYLPPSSLTSLPLFCVADDKVQDRARTTPT